MSDDRLLQAAIHYAKQGFKVFPCLAGQKGPATPHGFKDATTDVEQIRSWWEQNPDYNVAIATEGLIVLDYDDPNPGNWPESWPLFSEPLDDLFYHTPRNGSHSIMLDPECRWRNSTRALAPNIDTRATGGYVLVPPSRTKDGEYRFPQGGMQPGGPKRPPEWMRVLLDAHCRKATNGTRPPREGPPEESELIPIGQRNDSLATYCGRMRQFGASEHEMLAAATVRNATRFAEPLPEAEVRKIVHSIARYEPDERHTMAVEGVDLDPIEPHQCHYPDPGPFPDALAFSLPGLGEEIMEYTLKTAPRQQPAYALAGALALLSAITGRRIQDHSKTRTNLLIVAIGPTCSGKERPRQVNKQILAEVGWDILGPEEIVSSSGIYTSIRHRPDCLLQIDEMGRLFKAIRHSGAKTKHLADIPTVLMKLYNSSADKITGGGYANNELNYDLDQPHLTVFGSTVEENFVGALSREQLVDGFMNRLSIFLSITTPDQLDPVVYDIPASILEEVCLWRDFYHGRGNLLDEHPDPRVLEYTPDALERLKEYRQLCDKKQERGVWGRAYLTTKKYALNYQASADGPAVRTVTLRAVEWGCAVTDYQIRKTLSLAEDSMAETQWEADQIEALKWFRSKGEATMTEFCRGKFRKWDEKYRGKILKALEIGGRVLIVQKKKSHTVRGRMATYVRFRG